uniref:NADH-ubiquinone oxidoreductase chain 3 n=2 Tax=Ctenocephalides felis TaxID=7515 RepID=A0A8F4WII1_CTEFE|nr:NADH dehydrogenase subunit 3 [Ctenocephalides felis]QLI54053.1 NADH dehydrogenase subunit 3 [Ctenocephalides felis]QUO98913.1 NADH dehydrogenase subunit 3 [Ctenocephalides felis felis]QXG83123.1 NADH dehydrogenase subunit 3 [Ctenocephalides felis felis]
MYFIIIWSLIIFLLCMIIMLFSSLISMKSNYDLEKNSPFECGFDPMSSSRMPFSLHFFLIAIIFLIFDIEIALLLPMINLYSISMKFYWMSTSIFFIMILLLGLFHEWNQGMLKWN